jgi:predicted SAM-dependent methyltransferase/uncharacterized protein YukE
MLTNWLYRLYGRLTAIPGFGPRFDRWARARRTAIYRLRDSAMRIDRRWQRQTGPAVQTAVEDLSMMIGALRQSCQHLHEELGRQRSMIESLSARLDAADPAALQQQWQQQLYQHSHAVNLKVDNAIEALMRRVERAERQLGQAQNTPLPQAPARILQPQRLAQLMQRPQGLWLEVGCGDKPDPDRLNIDLRALEGVDIVAPADCIPLADGCAARLRAAHLVEHFTATDFVERVLPEWRRLLAPGGTLELITPDLHAMAQAWLRGQLAEPDLVHVLYGGQDYPADFHYHLYSPAALASLLQAHGMVEVAVIAAGRPSGLCLEFELHARKPTH